MKNRNRRSKEEMYGLIEQYLSSDLSQRMFYTQEHLCKSSFEYWLKKYRQEKGIPVPSRKRTKKSFIPVELPSPIPIEEPEKIQIIYPNGVQLTCPLSIGHQQLKALVGI